MTRLLTRPLVIVVLLGASAAAQALPGAPAPQTPQAPASSPVSAAKPADTLVGGVEVPDSYVIGPGDVLGVVFWREKELSGDVAVLPDGKITLPLINEVTAAGLTPAALRQKVVEAAKQFVTDPTATVVVRQVNSRKVFITGMVAKTGEYPLYQSMTVLQLIARAGGLLEYAKGDQIIIIRHEPGQQVSFKFNYKEVSKRKNLWQNIELKPGDTVVVP